jgi:hypothetical protein
MSNSNNKERFKSSDERVNNVAHVLERFERRFRFDDPRCVDRYIKGELTILCHFSVEGLDVEFVAQLHGKHCIWNRTEDRWQKVGKWKVGVIPHDIHPYVSSDVPSTIVHACSEKKFVFVWIAQLFQLPEYVPLPALIRLGCVDCVYNGLPNALYLSSSRGLVIRGAPSDREVHLPIRLRAASVKNNELVGQMVERASEILDYVGGNGCQCVGNRIDFSNVINALTGLRVFLSSDTVGVGIMKGPNAKIKILDVLFGPCDFCLNFCDHDVW